MAQAVPGVESVLLLSTLRAQRDHVLGILESLDEEALRRPVLPSGWSCLGLVNHLALDVERFWFRGVMAGEQEVTDGVATASDAWKVAADVPAEAVFARYRRECDLADTVIAAGRPDAAPAWWPGDLFGDFRMDTLREIVLHVIVETAAHAGHLDAARELIDGRQWMVLTD